MTTAEMARLYTEDHRTLREIAAVAGLSHVAVSKRLHAAGIATLDGTHPKLTCQQCGASYRRRRSQVKPFVGRFCSRPCYTAHIQAKATYRPWRYGQVLARAIVAAHFPLQPRHVVHHHDGDNTHNALTNLAVFASQADHMRHHRGGHSVPLWDGRKFSGAITPLDPAGWDPSGSGAEAPVTSGD